MPQSKFMRFINNSSVYTAALGVGFMASTALVEPREESAEKEDLQKTLALTGLGLIIASGITAKISGSDASLEYKDYKDAGHDPSKSVAFFQEAMRNLLNVEKSAQEPEKEIGVNRFRTPRSQVNEI